MEALTPGHLYSLDHFEQAQGYEMVQFIHKEENEEGELTTVQDGTTNEEVVKMLIDRLNYLQNIMACRENALAITKLEEALHWLEHRTLNRKAQGVEGTPKRRPRITEMLSDQEKQHFGQEEAE